MKIFSLDEANTLLAELDNILARIADKKEEAARLHDELLMEELLHHKERGSELYDPGRELQQKAQFLDFFFADLEKEIEKIRALGCRIRSLERGWIDFPAHRGGEVVYLCWKRGEKRIEYYHPAHPAASGRLPLA